MALIVNGIIFNKLQQWQVDFLKENCQQLKLTELKEHLGICEETIYRLLKALNLKRKRMWYRKLPNNIDVNKDLANPYLSHVKIADKYNVTPDVVAQRRKRAGLSVRRNVSRTRLEEKIASILDNLDIVYKEQKRIGKWSIDFYLGNKICLDVHGIYMHSKLIAKDRDNRKKEWLIKNGYQYIIIWEDQIENAIEILQNRLGDIFKWINKQEQ